MVNKMKGNNMTDKIGKKMRRVEIKIKKICKGVSKIIKLKKQLDKAAELIIKEKELT